MGIDPARVAVAVTRTPARVAYAILGNLTGIALLASLALVTALSNAQAILFITSIYAVAGVLNANIATGFATIIIMLGCNATYLAALGWLFQRAKMRVVYARLRGVLDGTIGALFILFGGRLLWRALAR